MADRYWVGGTGTWNNTTTTNWSATDGGAGGASVPSINGTDNVFFTSNSNVGTGSFTVTISVGVSCRDLTISGLDGAMTLAGTASLSVRGSMSLPATNLTWTNTGGLLFIGTTTYGSSKTITTSGVSLPGPVTFNSEIVTSLPTNNLVLQDAFTCTGTLTFPAGTLDLNGYTLTGTTFTTSSSNVRTLAFGTTGVINLTGTGNVWVSTTITGFSYTGTSNIRLTNSGATARSISPGTQTIAQAQNYYITAGTSTLSIGTGAIGTLDFTGSSGTFAQGTTNVTLYGNLTFTSTTTTTTSSGVLTLGATSGSRTITTAGITINLTITLNAPGATYTLADNFIANSSRNFTFTAGTLDINSKTTSFGLLFFVTGTKSYINGTLNAATSVTHTSGAISVTSAATIVTTGAYTFTAGSINIGDGAVLSVRSFSSSNSNARSIAYNTSGELRLTGTGTVWSTSTVTNFSYTGTSNVRLTNAGSTAITITAGAMSAAQAQNFYITAGTYSLTISSTSAFNNLDFTGFTGIYAQASLSISVFGNLTFSSGMTGTATNGVLTMAATSGTKTITTNGATIGNNITINGSGGGGTIQLADNFTQTALRTFGLTNGTLDINSKTTSMGVFTIVTGTHAITNGTVNCANVTHTSGDLSIGTGYNLVCTGTYTFNAGTITINNGVTLTTANFTSPGATARSIAFGTGAIDLTGTGLVWTNTSTGLSYTGTSNVRVIYSGSTGVNINANASSAATAMNYYITAGTYLLSIISGSTINSLDFTGFSGTYGQAATSITINQDLTLNSTMTSSTTTGTLTFGGATDSVLTGNGHSSNIRMSIAKSTSTAKVTLGSAYTQASNLSFLLLTGILDTANYNLTLAQFTSNAASGATTRSMLLGSSTVAITTGSWSVDSGLTLDAGTSTISMTSASSKNFIGGGETYYNLNQGGSGILTVSDSNIFNDIAATTRPSTITLTSGTTQTVSNFSLSGTAGNLVTLNSSTAGTAATLSKSSGTVTVNYLSIQDNAATGGATWLAPVDYGNVNVSGNSGWNFAAIGATTNTNFFAFFF